MRYLHWVLALVAALTVGHTAWALDPDSLTQEDYESIFALRDAGPEVTQKLHEADAAYARGEWQKAAAAYAQLPTGEDGASDGAAARLPLRRRCQALTELGQKSKALEACKQLVNLLIPNAADLQATIAASMLGTGRPSDAELKQVLTMSQRIENLDPDGPWLPAARCAIAERLKDRASLETCTAQLKEMAPQHRSTRHFQQALGQGPRLAMFLKLGLFAALLLGTLLTLGHRVLSQRRRALATVALPLLVLLLSWPRRAAAQDFGIIAEPSSGPQYSGPPTEAEAKADELDKELQDETQLLSELTDKIKAAEALILQKNDWPGALVDYNSIIAKVPYCGRCWRRLCEGYSYVGMPVEGAHACRQVIASPDGNAWDRAMLVHHLLTGPDREKKEIRDEAARAAADAVKLEPAERWGYDALCEIALSDNDLPALKSCSNKLDQYAPDDRKTLSLLFTVALADKRFGDAEALIERGRKGGLDAGTLAVMRKTLAAQGPIWWRLRQSAPLGLLAAAIAAALAFGIRFSINLRARSRASALAPRA